jgi:hypothetical protein
MYWVAPEVFLIIEQPSGIEGDQGGATGHASGLGLLARAQATMRMLLRHTDGASVVDARPPRFNTRGLYVAASDVWCRGPDYFGVVEDGKSSV